MDPWPLRWRHFSNSAAFKSCSLQIVYFLVDPPSVGVNPSLASAAQGMFADQTIVACVALQAFATERKSFQWCRCGPVDNSWACS